MKFVQWTLAAVGTIALAIVAAGFFLPSRFEVARTTVIKAPAEKIYDLIVEPRLWMGWSAWGKRDPAMDVTYSGPPFGQGAKWSWASKTENGGMIELISVEPNRRIQYALYVPYFNLRSVGKFVLDEDAGATRVTWSNSGDVGRNPLKHYLAHWMDRIVGEDFEGGLANLKAMAEKP